MKRIIPAVAVAAVLLAGGAAAAQTKTAATGLALPTTVTGNVTVAPGVYAGPKNPIVVAGAATVNMDGVTIQGSKSYLFNVDANDSLTINGVLRVDGGDLTTGLVQDVVADGKTASVTMKNVLADHVKSLVFQKAQSGVLNLTMSNVQGTNLGDGVRAVLGAVSIDQSLFRGGLSPPSGNPAGFHALDDNAGTVAAAANRITISSSEITGFTSDDFQGDSILLETRVAYADIYDNDLGYNTDSGGVDSKATKVDFHDNLVYSTGDRAISSHFGTLTSWGNYIAQSPVVHSKVYQGSGNLYAYGDTVKMTGYDASGKNVITYLAYANKVCCPGSGPASTYPRVGHITLGTITDLDGNVLTKPIHAEGGGTVVFEPATVRLNLLQKSGAYEGYHWTGATTHTSGRWTMGPKFHFIVGNRGCSNGGSVTFTVTSWYPLNGRVWWTVKVPNGQTLSKYSASVQTWSYTAKASTSGAHCQAEVTVNQ